MQREDLWYKNAVFYEVYVRAFRDSNGDGNGDLPGITSKLDYFQSLGVTCLWLLPIYPSPLLDDGYDIADYYGIHPDYGTLDDFKAFLDAAHSRGIRVITDLVLNHTSDQHPWFQSARADRNSPYRDYYVWSDTDEKYQDARIIFLDTEKSNWTWDERAGQFFWHRFYSSQPDLNYDNPAVQAEMINVMKFWLDMGVDGFRADAVPYLYEREGTNCENLPETHQYLKRLRRFIDEEYPDRILLCEANQWPEEVRAYFGDGNEFHMGFHFPLMPRVFKALRTGERSSIEWILSRTPEIPENCQWCTFLRNHDELTLEMVTEEERQWMWQEYAPVPRMRLNLGIRRRLAPLLDNNLSKIALANSILFTLTGSPVIYYGDEIGMGDNIWLEDRDGVRTPMQWDPGKNAGFSDGDPGRLYSPDIQESPYGPDQVSVSVQSDNPDSLLNVTKKMIAVHKEQKPLGWGELHWLPVENTAVAAYLRRFQDETLLILNNLTGSRQPVALSLSSQFDSLPVDVLTGDHYPALDRGRMALTLQPFQYLWLRI